MKVKNCNECPLKEQANQSDSRFYCVHPDILEEPFVVRKIDYRQDSAYHLLHICPLKNKPLTIELG